MIHAQNNHRPMRKPSWLTRKLPSAPEYERVRSLISGGQLHTVCQEAKDWKIGGENSAASTLGMHVNTLRGRMNKLGIKKPASR